MHHFTGEHIPFFPSANPEDINPNHPYLSMGRNACRRLMMGWSDNPLHGLLSQDIFYAVFVEKNPALCQGCRDALQEGFHHLYQYLCTHSLQTQEQAHFVISHALSFLPFFYPSYQENLQIPQWIQGEWKLVTYCITPIELTATEENISDLRRVFAYGLHSPDYPDAEPHLIFMGTTYPAGQGFVTQVNTDLEAFKTPGLSLYDTGRVNILTWIKQQTQKVHVCGMSLGGSLALLLTIDQGHLLSRVDAINPAGLCETWGLHPCDHWDLCTKKPIVHIHRQDRDVVSRFGVWKKEWQLWLIKPPSLLQAPYSYLDHALSYASLEGTSFVQLDPEQDNQERYLTNLFIYTMLRAFVYYLIVLPCTYVILPFVLYEWENPLHPLVCCLMLLMSFFNPIWIPFWSIMCIIALPFTLHTVFVAFEACDFMQTINQINIFLYDILTMVTNTELALEEICSSILSKTI